MVEAELSQHGPRAKGAARQGTPLTSSCAVVYLTLRDTVWQLVSMHKDCMAVCSSSITSITDNIHSGYGGAPLPP